MTVRKTDAFIADLEAQFEWYAGHASWEVAAAYLAAVEASCRLLREHPFLGPVVRSTHPRLRGWRFFVVFRPFHQSLVFYEVTGEDLVLRRVLHGHRDRPGALLK